jgi:hypothetical protein
MAEIKRLVEEGLAQALRSAVVHGVITEFWSTHDIEEYMRLPGLSESLRDIYGRIRK